MNTRYDCRYTTDCHDGRTAYSFRAVVAAAMQISANYKVTSINIHNVCGYNEQPITAAVAVVVGAMAAVDTRLGVNIRFTIAYSFFI